MLNSAEFGVCREISSWPVPDQSQKSYRVPTAQTPQTCTSGAIPASHERLTTYNILKSNLPKRVSLPTPQQPVEQYTIPPRFDKVLQLLISGKATTIQIPKRRNTTIWSFLGSHSTIYAFVANDPFRVFRDDDKIDLLSDGLTFDDIPTAEYARGTELSQGRVINLHGALSS